MNLDISEKLIQLWWRIMRSFNATLGNHANILGAHEKRSELEWEAEAVEWPERNEKG